MPEYYRVGPAIIPESYSKVINPQAKQSDASFFRDLALGKLVLAQAQAQAHLWLVFIKAH